MTSVLVVEDNPLNMELVFEILENQDFTPVGVVNGADAIAKTQKEVFDLILMDIGLPDMNGIEVTKIIKSRTSYKDVPVIALTSFAMKEDVEIIMAEGFNEYMQKPIEVTDFVQRLEKYRK